MRNVILQDLVSLDGFACPVVPGGGKPLFRDKVDSFGMKLLEAQSFDRGAVLLAYTAANGRFAAS